MPDSDTTLSIGDRLLTHLGQRRSSALASRSGLAGLDSQQRATSPMALAEVDGLIDELENIDRREQVVERLVQVRSEPLTYSEDGPHSYFADVMRAHLGGHAHTPPGEAARDRLERHAREMTVELERRDANARRTFGSALERRGGSYEKRVNPNRTDGQGGYLVPPLWLIDRFAAAPTAGRPLADLIGTIPLPAGTDSINIPRLTVNPANVIQTADGATVTSTDFTDSSASSTVETLAGRAIVSQQLLDQAPRPYLDAVVFGAMEQVYAASLETQLINGSGGSGQLTGLNNVSGIVAVAYTSASPTVAGAYAAFLQAAAQLSDARFRPPEAAFVSPRRWYWLQSTTFTDSASLATPANPPGRGYMPPEAALAGDNGPAGPIAGIPTYMDGSVPQTLGGGTNQDLIVLTRPTDHLLFESDPYLIVTPEPSSGTLQAQLSLHRYAAFIGGLYPTSTAVVSGTGLTAPSNY